MTYSAVLSKITIHVQLPLEKDRQPVLRINDKDYLTSREELLLLQECINCAIAFSDKQMMEELL